MKTIKFTILTALTVLSTLSCIFLSGCNTIKAVPLAYTSNEGEPVAYIYFDLYRKSEISGATFITYDNKETPKAERFTYWSPVELPADVPVKAYLHVYYKEPRSDFGDKDCLAACCTSAANAVEASRDVNKDIIFNIPPLEPDAEYTISYRKGFGIPGSSYITLTKNDTKEVIREIEFN